MRVIQALQGIEATSGISKFVVEQCNRQVALGVDVLLIYQHALEHTLAPKVEIRQSNGTLAGFLPFPVPPDLVHLHALWSPFSVRVMRECGRMGVPYVVSPHGCLMPRVFTKGWVKKKLFWHLFLKPLIEHAKVVHCTSEAEVEACRRLGLNGPYEIIPLGCDVPDGIARYMKQKKVLFLGRIGEEKGLPLLLQAWKSLCVSLGKEAEDWRLQIAGPDWRGFKRLLDAQIESDRIPRVEFLGSANEEMKDQLYREASLFVLPSPMENFSVVVLDALAYGVPVIATQGTPWAELETRKCGWWIRPNSGDDLFEALRDALLMQRGERDAMGRRGRALAQEKYAWDTVVMQTLRMYESALG